MSQDDRFTFGANWLRFAGALTDEQLARARDALVELLGTEDLGDRTFLDIGSGSGLHSLAAHQLGAEVTAFDYDPQSVSCSIAVRDRFGGTWPVRRGDILDDTFVEGLGTFDWVYSWGVLHHTGDIDGAIDNAARLVRPGGHLVLALYNDTGRSAARWMHVKRRYVLAGRAQRRLIEIVAGARMWGPTLMRDVVSGSPMRTWRAYGDERGMSPLVDLRDWVGGFPYQPSRPEAVIERVLGLGFDLRHLRTVTGFGCNEFRFEATERRSPKVS